jgi:hypothetical protein
VEGWERAPSTDERHAIGSDVGLRLTHYAFDECRISDVLELRNARSSYDWS